MSSTIKAAVFSGKWTTIGSAATMLGGVLFSGLTIKYLGLEKAGFATLVSTFASMGTSFGGFGLGAATVSEVSIAHRRGDHNYAQRVVGTSLCVNLGVGLVLAALLILGADFILEFGNYSDTPQDAKWFCYAVGAATVFWQIVSVQKAALRAIQAFDSLAALNWIQGFAVGLVTATALKCMPLLAVAGVIQLGGALICVVYSQILLTRRFGYSAKLEFDCRFLGRARSFGSGTYATTLFGIAVDGVDKLILAKLGGVEILAAYNFVRKIYQQIHALFNEQCAFLFPLFSDNGSKSIERISGPYDKMMWLVGSGGCIAFGNLVLFGPSVGRVAISEAFGAAMLTPTYIFSAVGFFHSLTNVPFYVSYALRRSWPNFWLNFFAGVISLGAMIAIGYGFGAKYAMFGQFGILVGVLLYLAKWNRDLHPVRAIALSFSPVASSLCIFGTAVMGSLYYETYDLGIGVIVLLSVFYSCFAVLGILGYEHARADKDRRLRALAKALDMIAKTERFSSMCIKCYGVR